MASTPSWWFKTVNMSDKYIRTTTATKHGEHKRYFIKGEGRVSEKNYWNRFKIDLFQNQTRIYAQKLGIRDWREAQSRYSTLRKEYIEHQKLIDEYYKKHPNQESLRDKTKEQEELFKKYYYGDQALDLQLTVI